MTIAKRPLRVTHVVHALEVGGLEKLVLELVRRADGDVIQPEIVCTDFIGPLATLYGLEHRVSGVDARPGFDWRAVARLAKHFRASGTDIIHSHNERAHYLSVLVGHLLRIPVHVNTRHSVYPPATWRGGLRRRATAMMSNVIVAVSTEVRDTTAQIDRIPVSKLRVILNGTDTAAARLPRAEARHRLGVTDSDFVLGGVGRLAPEKDYISFLEAFERACPQLPQMIGIVFGDGAVLKDLREAARARGLDRLHFRGYRSDTVTLLPAFDLFLHPSLSEGTSLSVMEAMAAGLPIIAASIGGTAEVLGGGEAGVLIPPRNVGAYAHAIVSLVGDPERRARLANAARRRAQAHFSIDAVARAYEALYLEQARSKGLTV